MTKLHPDLFGGKTPIKEPVTGEFARLKKKWDYGPSESPTFMCGTCKNLIKKVLANGKNVYKCELIGDSASEASDVKLNHICMKWEGS